MFIKIKSRQVPLLIKKSARAKYLRAAFSSDFASITITHPKRCSKRDLQQFIESQVITWANDNDRYVSPIDLTAESQIILFGQKVLLEQQRDIRSDFILPKNTDKLKRLIVLYRSKEKVGELLKCAIFELAEEVFNKWCTQYADQLNVSYDRLKIKDLTSRWGSCSKINKSINLSFRLAFAPEAISRYVCAHEVSHLVHANHSSTFWQVVSELDKDYLKHRKWLRNNGAALHKYNFG